MKNKLTLILLLFLFVSSCETTTQSGKNALDNITYVKDLRTGLCFAKLSSFNTSGTIVSITHVPCDSVKAYLR